MAVPVTGPNVAVIVAVPGPTPLAAPLEVMVATAEDEVLQLTYVVKLRWLPSLNVPVAVNCWTMPEAMLEVAGLRAIDKRVAESTVSWVKPLTEPDAATIVV